jgi:hypothetical protein
MRYKIKAHPTDYAGVHFRSRLEARWAAFFNCMKWKWEYEPVDLEGWTPDFRVATPIVLLAEVKPFDSLDQFRLHPCWDLGLCLGLNIQASGWRNNGRVVTLMELGYNTEGAWIAAGNLTQWKPKPVKKKKKVVTKHWKELLREGL